MGETRELLSIDFKCHEQRGLKNAIAEVLGTCCLLRNQADTDFECCIKGKTIQAAPCWKLTLLWLFRHYCQDLSRRKKSGERKQCALCNCGSQDKGHGNDVNCVNGGKLMHWFKIASKNALLHPKVMTTPVLFCSSVLFWGTQSWKLLHNKPLAIQWRLSHPQVQNEIPLGVSQTQGLSPLFKGTSGWARSSLGPVSRAQASNPGNRQLGQFHP